MSIQRYTQRDISELEFPGADEESFDSVKFVLYADHQQQLTTHGATMFTRGAADARARIRQAVEALDVDDTLGVDLFAVLSIIDTDREHES